MQVANSLDKEHSKEYKKLRSELKKKTDNSLRLMKKHKKTKGCVYSVSSLLPIMSVLHRSASFLSFRVLYKIVPYADKHTAKHGSQFHGTTFEVEN